MWQLLTPSEMGIADRLTIEGGIPGRDLMERAGNAVAEVALAAKRDPGPIAVLCGPGNNGGDGFVASRIMAGRGADVRIWLLGGRDRLKGDAAWAAESYRGTIENSEGFDPAGAAVVVDALFGAGLDRPVEGHAADLLDLVNASSATRVSVDVPSGLDGESGAVLGAAVGADHTVTFFRSKPGHHLLPGRGLCGRLHIADIGIRDAVLDRIEPQTFINDPELWHTAIPAPAPSSHKYSHGHVLAVSGGIAQTGAIRLAALAALRAGSGLVTVAAPASALTTHASHLTSVMLARFHDPEDLAEILGDRRKNAVVMGPALGVDRNARTLVETALISRAASVLDADALTLFADHPDRLFSLISSRNAPVVITPHDGEFARLFPDLADLQGKPGRARQAAERSGAVVVLKGSDTVIADAGGRAAINTNAPPWLATAGSGDVLAGIVAGHLAMGVPPFEAACAAVWRHGGAASMAGSGLIAEDLPRAIPPLPAGFSPPKGS